MNKITRRSVTAAAWTTPIVAMSAPAPAFAASQPLSCRPTARCKLPGDPQDKSYVIEANCSLSNGGIRSVEVQDRSGNWIPARLEDGAWVAPGFGDSRRDRPVRITDMSGLQETYIVSFPPC